MSRSKDATAFMAPRTVTVRHRWTDENARRNREALSRMDYCQKVTGHSRDELIARQREMKAAALQRFGLAA